MLPQQLPQFFFTCPAEPSYGWGHRLHAGEAQSLRWVAVGRDCGNGGVLPERDALPRLSPPLPQQWNPIWWAWVVLCVCELWHSPLRQASRDARDTKLGIRFYCCKRVPQSTLMPLPLELPNFSSQIRTGLLRATGWCVWLGLVSGSAIFSGFKHHCCKDNP